MVSIRASLGATSFTSCTLMVNNACVPDNKSSVNGFAQQLNSGIRSLAPLLGGTMWSWSIEIDVFFNSYIVYTIIAIIFMIATFIAYQIPMVLNTPPELPADTTASVAPASSISSSNSKLSSSD
jgi:hypothetical protein